MRIRFERLLHLFTDRGLVISVDFFRAYRFAQGDEIRRRVHFHLTRLRIDHEDRFVALHRINAAIFSFAFKHQVARYNPHRARTVLRFDGSCLYGTIFSVRIPRHIGVYVVNTRVGVILQTHLHTLVTGTGACIIHHAVKLFTRYASITQVVNIVKQVLADRSIHLVNLHAEIRRHAFTLAIQRKSGARHLLRIIQLVASIRSIVQRTAYGVSRAFQTFALLSTAQTLILLRGA